jgi:hypothetical protein
VTQQVQRSELRRTDEIRQLISAHRELEDETLLLAVQFEPGRESDSPDDVYLFEVYDGYHHNIVDRERGDFTDISYGSTDAFPLPRDAYLHIILTNPIEFIEGLRSGWKLASELKGAVNRGAYEILHEENNSLIEAVRG